MNQITSTTDYTGQPADRQPLQARPDQRLMPGTVSEPGADGAAAASATTPTGAAGQPSGDGSTAGHDTAAPSADTGQASGPAPEHAPRPGLSAADVQLLQRGLSSGDTALARRSDLVELYTRVVKLFETLNTGVGDMYVAKAETDRTALSARIDGLEDAVNRMEGALRIEFEPVLRQTLGQVLADQTGARPKRHRGLGAILMLVAGLGLGAVFHAPLTEAASVTVSKAETYVSMIVAKLSPNGGSI
jgi:hypothetical protein